MNQNNNNKTVQPDNKRPPKLGVWKVTQSILAGALGVQSDKRRQEDFASASPWAYIAGGLLFTIGLIGGLILLVNAVLANA